MKRIVIADDQPLIRHSIRTMLEAAGHQVIAECPDGPAALQKTLELRPDLLITELALPRLGGLEVIRRLRRHNTKKRTQKKRQLNRMGDIRPRHQSTAS